MTRIFTGRFLPITLLLALACFSLTTAVRAAGWFGEEKPVDPPPTTPPGEVVIDLNTTNTAPRETIPTRQQIYQLIQQNNFVEAEEEYNILVNSWGEDDTELLATMETAVLQQQSSTGDEQALFALLRAGDRSTLTLFRQQLRSGDTQLAKSDQLKAIRLLGNNKQAVDYPLLTGLLKNDDPEIVNTAILALGDMGQTKAIEELLALGGRS